MYSGKGASQWDNFRDYDRVAVGGGDDEDWSKESLKDIKIRRPGHPHDANTAWAISNGMKIGDVVVALGGQKKVKGVGIIKSDYMPPKHPDNKEHDYKHSRTVKWLIIDDLDIKSYNFVTVTIISQKNMTKGTEIWNEIQHEYSAKKPEYEKIFTNLNPNLSDLIRQFVRELDGEMIQNLQEEHVRRCKNVQDKLTENNLAILSETDLLDILRETDAARGMGMNVGTIIPKNGGIEKFKVKLINILENTNLNETDINKSINSFEGLGPAKLSELLCLKYPTKFWITNKVTDEFFHLIGVDIKKNIPRGKKLNDGLKYVAMEPYLQNIRDMLNDNGFQNATFLDADMFVHWATQQSQIIMISTDKIQLPPTNPQLKPLHEAFTYTKNVILYGPPGTGKTYISQQFIEEFSKNQDETKAYHEFITFHQSYGYEDFMEGLKPSVEDGKISYNIEAGVFKEFCDKARNDGNNKYLFVIDEINRGNISKIFGELITLIEDDKRDVLSTKLPYSKKDFTVPPNVHILGTMNTADRSIALLDIALRRRFTFLELMPKASLLDCKIGKLNINDLLVELNKKITKLIDRNHQIGHSYFCKVASQIKDGDYKSAKTELHFVWYRKIIPLLQEYFYYDWVQLKQVLGVFVTNVDTDNSINVFEPHSLEFIRALESIANNSTK